MKKKTLSIIATLLFVVQGAWAQETETPTWSGSGTSDDPYLIQSVADWDKLAEGSKTNTYEGVHFKQTFSNNKGGDPYAEKMVGSVESCPFGGIYDGGGNRLDVQLEYETEWAVAPFRFVRNATIKHLYVYGKVEGGIHVSGLVGRTVNGEGNEMPTNTIEDCRVGAYIYSYSTHAGGFIGHGGNANNILKGCLFDGRIYSEYNGTETTYAAPFIGWCEYAADDRNTLQGCFAKGTYTDFTNTALYFVLQNISYTDLTTSGVVVDRTYHNQSWNDGHHAYTITSGTEGMTIQYFFELNEPGLTYTDYSTSGIRFYKGTANAVGIVLYDVDKNVLYLKSGEKVAFKIISSSANYSFTNISADKGELVKPHPGGEEYDLTMTNANSVITGSPYVVLYNSDNSTKLRNINEMKGVTVKLNNRTLSKDGCWNTLCLPFGVELEASPLAGATVKELTSASFSGGTLTLNFSDDLSAIEAGKPYIVKWTKPENYAADEHDIVAPVFDGVTINSSETTPITSTDGSVSFVGTYNLIDIGNDGDDTKLYLGAGDKLYYPTGQMKISAFQSYFQLADGITADDRTDGIRSIVLNFGDEATGINNVQWSTDNGQWSTDNGQSETFTLDGRRLRGTPTKSGIYVRNGRKVVVK